MFSSIKCSILMKDNIFINFTTTLSFEDIKMTIVRFGVIYVLYIYIIYHGKIGRYSF